MPAHPATSYEVSRLGLALGLDADATARFAAKLPAGSLFKHPQGRFHADRAAVLSALGASAEEARVLDRMVQSERQTGAPSDFVEGRRADAKAAVAALGKGQSSTPPAGREAEIEEARKIARRVAGKRC